MIMPSARPFSQKLKSFFKGFLPEGRLARLLLASATLGLVIGFTIYAYDFIVEEKLLHWLFDLPLVMQAILPFVGIFIAVVVLRFVGGRNTNPGTADEFIRQFHEPNPKFRVRDLPAKLLAGIATIGFGGGLGLEGPSIYIGSSLGINLGRPFKWFRKTERKMLMVAGAAAGVAAIFKAPATGVIFALESPYRDDSTKRALLPALIAAAVSFTVFTLFSNTEAIFKDLGESDSNPISTLNLLGGAVVGIVAGLAGRVFAYLVRWSKDFRTKTPVVYRLIIGGLILAGMVVLTDWLFNSSLSLGPGTQAALWAIDPERGLGLIALLFGIRILVTLTTVGMGGTGGLFIPLASLGIIMGSFIGNLIGQTGSNLYPILGLAAFLAAGYRVPFTAVVFVAEATFGSPFVVPALIASALSQVVAGPASVASYQRVERQGHLEGRMALPITSALTTDVLTVPTDATVQEFVYQHVLANRTRDVPVTENGLFKGMCSWQTIAELDQTQWTTTNVEAVYIGDCSRAMPTWTLHDVLIAMEKDNTETIPVVDAEDALIGVVYEDDIIKLRDLLEETGN